MDATTTLRIEPEAIETLAATLGPGPGPRGRIGLIQLSNGHTCELEMREMMPGDDVVVYVNRIRSEDVNTLDTLRAMEEDMARAASLILPAGRLDVMAYGCTSGAMAMGEETVVRRIREVRPGIPVTTPITAARQAFEALGVGRVTLLTPYSLETTGAMRDYLVERGTGVLHTATFDVGRDSDINRVEPEAIRDAARGVDRPGADALFICCTALRACRVIEAIEADLEKPVVTSNQALAWHALRLAGYAEPIPGYGRLMRL